MEELSQTPVENTSPVSELTAWYLVTPDQQIYQLEDEDPILVLMDKVDGDLLEDFPVPIDACEDDFRNEDIVVLSHIHVRELLFNSHWGDHEPTESPGESSVGGGFTDALMRVFSVADSANYERLRTQFPNHERHYQYLINSPLGALMEEGE